MDWTFLIILAALAVGLPLLLILNYKSRARKPMSSAGVKITFAICGLIAVVLGAWSFVPLKILERVPNSDGTLEAVIAQTQPSFGDGFKVLIRVPGNGVKTSEQVLMVGEVQPSLGLQWRGDQLVVKAQQANLLFFDPEVDVQTPKGLVHVSVHTNVAYWTPSHSRAGSRYPGQ